MVIFKPVKLFLDSFSCCPACLQPADGLCAVCQSFLTTNERSCQRCALPLVAGDWCADCLSKPPPWQRVIAPWHFEGLTRFLIHQFKYHYDRAAGESLARAWLAQAASQHDQIDALLAVPMHRKKHASRGINHADLLARQFAKQLGIARFNGLKRVQATQALEGLTRAQRRRELQQAFRLDQAPPRRVAIVDDVLTTGATAGTIAELLKRNGCQYIEVWALARTPSPT